MQSYLLRDSLWYEKRVVDCPFSGSIWIRRGCKQLVALISYLHVLFGPWRCLDAFRVDVSQAWNNTPENKSISSKQHCESKTQLPSEIQAVPGSTLQFAMGPNGILMFQLIEPPILIGNFRILVDPLELVKTCYACENRFFVGCINQLFVA